MVCNHQTWDLTIKHEFLMGFEHQKWDSKKIEASNMGFQWDLRGHVIIYTWIYITNFI